MPYKDPRKQKDYFKTYYLTHIEKKREQSKKRHRKLRNSPEYKAAQLIRSKRWAKANPERRKEIYRKHSYGITPDEYKDKVKKQKNRCALCGKKETNIDRISDKVKALSVDHDHKTGKNRDLLCGNCNRGLGLFLENIEALKKAIKYLKKHRGV